MSAKCSPLELPVSTGPIQNILGRRDKFSTRFQPKGWLIKSVLSISAKENSLEMSVNANQSDRLSVYQQTAPADQIGLSSKWKTPEMKKQS